MLTGKQKSYLRSLAHHLNPIMQIGKNGVTDNFIETFTMNLESHELLKISVLQNTDEDKDIIAKNLCDATNCDLVQIIGNQLVFYRQSHKEDKTDKIELPR
jgi:RNA-binding protein